MTNPLTLAVFGANGATGRPLVRLAAERGHQIRAIEPDWPDRPDLPAGVAPRQADVLNDDLGPLLEGADAVVSCIGLGLSAKTALNPPPLYTEGTERMIAAMRQTGVRRIVVISASFVATNDRGPAWFKLSASTVLSRIFDQMGEMEHRLRQADDLDWTAVRPGWLLEGDLTEDYTVAPDIIPRDMIRTRHSDLAHFMLHCAESGDWRHATPAIARPEPEADNGPGAMLKALAG